MSKSNTPPLTNGDQPAAAIPKGERIAKRLARAGVASRREVERMIEAGRIHLNGQLLQTPAVLVTNKDIILVDNVPVEAKQAPRLWRYHKPDGFLTTNKDPEGRPTVFENLPKTLPRVISIGRLDMTSEGLLLLTNDGELARILELPQTGWARKYRARIYGRPTQEQLDSLLKGVFIDGKRSGPIEAKLDKQQGGNAWVSITLREGKNREIRRAFETLDMRVNRLIRLSYGPFQLGDLLSSGVEEVSNRILRDQVGHLIDIPTTRPTGTIEANKKQTRSGHKKFGRGGKKVDPKARFKKGSSPAKSHNPVVGKPKRPAPKKR